MSLIPSLKQINSKDDLNTFSKMYSDCSGLPIPITYMTNKENRVFAIYSRNKIIGGFILGRDSNFRTLQYFAKKENQTFVIDRLGDLTKYTEICCFWIARKNRTNTFLNIFIWLAMTYTLRMYGTKYLLFGTCSSSLARLYGQTSKSIQIHLDNINNKSTYIFKAHSSSSTMGMLEIINHKLKRTLKTTQVPKIFSRISNILREVLPSISISNSPN